MLIKTKFKHETFEKADEIIEETKKCKIALQEFQRAVREHKIKSNEERNSDSDEDSDDDFMEDRT